MLVSHAASARDVCQAGDDLAGTIAAMPQVAAVLKPGATLRVLAVGSATMFGPDASLSPGTVTSQSLESAGSNATPTVPATKALSHDASDRAFPSRMARALEASIPGLKVVVVVRGGRGMMASDMLALLREELARGSYQLVLWQTGTVEAVRNSAPGDFAQTLANGAEAVEAAHANLILIDSQYSRFLQTNSNMDPYSQALQTTAALPGVLLFHRFDLMHAWVTDGQIDLGAKPRGRIGSGWWTRCTAALGNIWREWCCLEHGPKVCSRRRACSDCRSGGTQGGPITLNKSWTKLINDWGL